MAVIDAISDKEVKNFINAAVDNKSMSYDLSKDMKQAIYSYLVNQVKDLSQSHDTNVYLPTTWTNEILIKRAFQLTEYRGLLTLADAPQYKVGFSDNYLYFSQKLELEKFLDKGNIFLLYVHVTKLFRQIRELNDMGTSTPLSPTENTNRIAKLHQCYSAMKYSLTCLTQSMNGENSFWITALCSLALHAMASIHYIQENGDLYNLDESKNLLMRVEYLCAKGIGYMKSASTTYIDFYTLNKTLLSTLPYQSFEQQLEDIKSLQLLEVYSTFSF